MGTNTPFSLLMQCAEDYGARDGDTKRTSDSSEERVIVRIGASLFLVAAGAILRWGITDEVQGVNLAMLGLILLIVGVIGLALSLVLASMRRRTDVIHEGEP